MNPVIKLVAGIVVVAVLLLLGDSFYIVKEYQQAVILHFGKFITSVQEPGLHMKMPFGVEKAKKVNTVIVANMRRFFPNNVLVIM